MKCKTAILKWFVQHTIDNGGEGVILQKSESKYLPGRSLSLVKLKTSQNDQEGIVIGVESNNDILLKLPNGLTFTVPEENVHIPSPSLGDIVTFSCDSKSRQDIPSNVCIYRIRTDLVWDEVVYTFIKDDQFLTETSQIKGFKPLPVGYWTKRNMRSHMEIFAKERGLDPLSSDTWTKSYSAFYQSKNGRKIIRKFNGRYYDAVQQLFPEIKFDTLTLRIGWTLETRRRFFEVYAEECGFDPQNPENWYSRTEQLSVLKGSLRVLRHYKNSVPRALMDLFPDIGLEMSKFSVGSSVWSSVDNRRFFFENYAQTNSFNAFVAENWYNQSREKIIATKGARAVLAHHAGSIPRALAELFPNVAFDSTKFLIRQTLWRKEDNRRVFFETFAKENGFDPKIPENWYFVSREKIMLVKGAHAVMSYHKFNVSNALLDLFPAIGLDKSKLVDRTKWNTPDKRRRFFEKFAEVYGFDPNVSKNWYSQPRAKIMAVKGAHVVLSYHNDSVPNALAELFPHINFDRLKF